METLRNTLSSDWNYGSFPMMQSLITSLIGCDVFIREIALFCRRTFMQGNCRGTIGANNSSWKMGPLGMKKLLKAYDSVSPPLCPDTIVYYEKLPDSKLRKMKKLTSKHFQSFLCTFEAVKSTVSVTSCAQNLCLETTLLMTWLTTVSD